MDKPPRAEGLLAKELLDSILRAYAVVYFSQRRWIGILFLTATMIVPRIGACGLLGVLVALGIARLLNFHPEAMKNGSYLFNPLLISLFVGYMGQTQDLSLASVLALVVTCSLMSLLLTVFLSGIMHDNFGLPSISWPSLLIVLATARFLQISSGAEPLDVTLTSSLPMLPEVVTSYLSCLGAIFFIPLPEVGLILFVCWLIESRMIVVYSIVGYACGLLSAVMLIGLPEGPVLIELGLNWILCGIALGCVFFIPSLSSICVVALGATFATFVTWTFRSWIDHTQLPPIALGFNIAVPLLIYAMRKRMRATFMHGTPFFVGAPEDNLRHFWLYRARFPHWAVPSVRPPFVGERLVTQGFGGELTHQGDYEFGLDFEVIDEAGESHTGDGSVLENFYTFNTPVLAPENGTVVTVVNNVPDREIGSQNLSQNWGNLVVLYLDNGQYTALCHLRKGSITVEQGDRVETGQKIAVSGNSGRSPVPHLHMQLQHQPSVGAASIPFRLRHFLRRNGPRHHYVHQGVPDEGDRIEPVVFDEAVEAFFDDIPSKQFSFEVVAGNRSWKETILCEVNESGEYVMRSDRFRAKLKAVVYDHVFYMQQFQGNRRSLLCWFWLGLSRVPFVSDRRVEWTDSASTYPLLNLHGKILMDLWAPLGQDPLLKLSGDVHLGGGSGQRRLHVSTSLESSLGSWMFRDDRPRSIELSLDPNEWVVEGRVQLDRGEITFQRIGSERP
jgi:urea transporter